MSITINIESDLKARLGKLAAAQGYQLDDFIVKMLEEQVTPYELTVDQKRDLELLQKINLGLPVSLWERYDQLKEKREAELLSEAEQHELIEISDQIEESNAARMPFLIELAKLRKISLETLLEQLDLKY